jgi:hypothetical protein
MRSLARHATPRRARRSRVVIGLVIVIEIGVEIEIDWAPKGV